ncbi:MAG: carboxypeptidase regulatory-like domain-containing protein [bacterium]|nr:carboxypeptidase regulatory-like domain-containing protein [bacterium]
MIALLAVLALAWAAGTWLTRGSLVEPGLIARSRPKLWTQENAAPAPLVEPRAPDAAVEVGAEPAAAASKPEPSLTTDGAASPQAALMLYVVDEQSNTVLGAAVSIRTADAAKPWNVSHASTSRLVVYVPCERDLVVEVSSPSNLFAPESRRIAAIPAGAHRKKMIGVSAQGDAFLTGRVRAAEDGTPLAGAEVRITTGKVGVTSRALEAPRAVTDDDGRFRLAHVSDERAWLQISAKGRATERIEVLHGPGRGAIPFDARLAAGGTLHGLVDVDQAPITYHMLHVERGSSGSSMRWSCQLEQGRRYRLDDLPTGVPLRVTVRALHVLGSNGGAEPRPLLETEVLLTAGEVRELDIRISGEDGGLTRDLRTEPVLRSPR